MNKINHHTLFMIKYPLKNKSKTLFLALKKLFSNLIYDVIVIGGGHAGCEAAYGNIKENI